MSHPVLHVQMLGGFSFHLDAGPAPSRLSRSSASLLAFLILHRDRPQTRDLLAGRFWSDLAEDKARRRLSNALWQVNKAWKEDPARAVIELLTTTTTTVGISSKVSLVVDMEAFTRRLDEFERRHRTTGRDAGLADLTSIVDSYRGELLDGHYDEWIEVPRKRVRDRYLGALDRLIQLHTGQGDYDAALRHARALVDQDHLREEWHRDVMRLCALSGQATGAERQYEICRHTLADELGVDPSPETTELIERIRRDASAPPVVLLESSEERLPLIGRGEERAALLGRINELVGGKGGVLLVEGEAGIGKSRLIEEVIRGAEWRGVQVLVGEHSETTVLAPYHGLRTALKPATSGLRGEHLVANLEPVWLRQASVVLPELQVIAEPTGRQDLRPQEEPWRATEALAQVILAQSRPRPTVLVLEDVHFGDEDTMAVLVQLGDRLIDSGVLVCLTYQLAHARQSPPIWAALAELEAKPGSSRLVIPPLVGHEVRQLVMAEIGPGRLTDSAMDRLLASTGGNPAVILELLRTPTGVIDERAFDLPDAGRLGARGPLVPKLVELLSRRVETVGENVRRVLQVVAALARPATARLVATILGADRNLVIAALADALEQGFCVETADGVVFASDQLRRAVYDREPSGDRVTLHRAIVTGLRSEPGVGVEHLAHHAWLAEEWSDAYLYHLRAADAALAVNAYQTTAEHFGKADQAAVRAGIGDGDRVGGLLAYERVLDTLGRRSDQRAIIDRLTALADLEPGQALEIRLRRAWLLANTDSGSEAARLAAEGVDPARAAGLGVGELFTIIGTALVWAGRQQEAIEPLEQAVTELGNSGRSALEARLTLGRTVADLGGLAQAEEQLEGAYDEAVRVADVRHQVEALGHLATLHNQQGREVAAEASFLEAISLAREIGYRHGEGRNLVNLAAFYLDRGQSGRAVGLLRAAAEVFASLGNGRGEAFVKYNAAYVNHWFLGQDNVAWDQATEAATLFRSIGDERTEALCLNTLACIQRRRGRRRHARRQLSEALAKTAARGDRAAEALTHLHLALVTLELGQLSEASGHVCSAMDTGLTSAEDRLLPALEATRARILAEEGRLDEAVVVVEGTVALNRPGVELPHLVAWWCAEVLAAAGRHREAADQVALAHELLTSNLEDLSPAEARRARTEVPEHRAMSELRERYFVTTEMVRIPRWDAPTGRPLEPTDLVAVQWTVSEPDDRSLASPAARRRHRILRLTTEARAQGGMARVSDLASILGVSERTIKRDLAALRSAGRQPVTRGSTEEKSQPTP
jgi:DNA-binding SARP family transcriptional activator/tetratricopeptide (TPR) repeat protein